MGPIHADATDVSGQRVSIYVQRSQRMALDLPFLVFNPVMFRAQDGRLARGKAALSATRK